MRAGMGCGLGWEQDGNGSVVRWEWAVGKGSDTVERGIVDRGQQELGQGDMGAVPGQAQTLSGHIPWLEHSCLSQALHFCLQHCFPTKPGEGKLGAAHGILECLKLASQ